MNLDFEISGADCTIKDASSPLYLVSETLVKQDLD